MGQRFQSDQFALYKRIDEILWFDWDPIGINAIDAARDEYYSYLFPLMNMVLDGTNREQVATYLYECETVNMGMVGNKSHCEYVAGLICEAKDKIFIR